MKFNELQFESISGTYGLQYLFRRASIDFENGYGISIVHTSGGAAKEEYEIAVMHNGTICYNNPITSDVIRFLTPNEVEEYIQRIHDLPPNTYCTHVEPRYE